MEVPDGIGTKTEINPVGIGLGIGIIISGLLQFFVLNVCCDMARNLLMIRQSVGKTVESDEKLETLTREEL